LGQGLDGAAAATTGAFVHGMAADVATQALGGSHLMASDLPDAIARACEMLRQG
jgi:NAD(P)H-hydrate repair Nnr-like enzyme with NAD(P)H-hydrate dehydratase domain